MCGICGIIGAGADRPEQEEVVRRMMSTLAHRGPDAEGQISGRGFSFGHRRLSIIDLQHGRQPMQSEDSRYTLVYNGEIYNYIELRNQLIQQGNTFKTFSDTEVLLQLLIRDGEEALPLLNGMFAFAFYDKETGKWLLGRDPFGIKPLYYIQSADLLHFSSEIKSLFCAKNIRPKQNWKSLQHYLTFQFSLSEETLFAGVKKVEPGCYMVGDRNGVRCTVRYWDTNYQIDNHHTEEYFKERLLTLLKDSTKLQIRSDVPLGAYLSGGLDSSCVASMASDHLSCSIKVFTGRFTEGPAYDESTYARYIAEKIGAQYFGIAPTAEEFIDSLPKLIYAMDEPVAGPGLFPQYIVSQLAAEHVKVVLGGQGGDEIFGGYARYLIGYLEQSLKGAIFETQEEAQHVVTLASIIPNLPLLKEYRPLMQRFWQDGLFEDMDKRYFRLIDRSPDLQTILTDDAKKGFNQEEVFADFQKIFNHPDTKSYVNKMTHFDLKSLLPALLQVEDRVSMAVSLESRVPLLDTRIVDLLTTMPPQMKFKGGKTKYIFKEAIKNFIPTLIVNRKDKMGFPVPLKEWMERGIVRDFVYETLLSRASRERGLFDPKALESLIVKEKAFGRQIWGALCLELWQQRFIDGNAS